MESLILFPNRCKFLTPTRQEYPLFINLARYLHNWAVVMSTQLPQQREARHTQLCLVSASGYILSPLMVYPRKKSVPDNLKVGAIPDTLFCNSDNGWINSGVYIEWLKFFSRKIPPIRPVLLIQDGHGTHISIDVIEFARENGIHILCLPAHTTHILQPLDVGVFKSFKSNFSKACTRYIASHPGRVITTDVLASLVAEAWPCSFTLLNIMSGFRKCGMFPFNPSAVDDRQLAPSKAFQTTPIPSNVEPVSESIGETISEPSSPLFTEEQESLYSKRYEEGYDLDDPSFVAWLKINHPDKCVSVMSGTSSSIETSASSSILPSSNETVPPFSDGATCSSDILSEILVLPQPQAPKRKRKTAMNSKAVCITDGEVLQELKEKEQKKIEEKELMDAKKREREEKKREREENKIMKQKVIQRKKREREEKRRQKDKAKEEKARVQAEKRKQKDKEKEKKKRGGKMNESEDRDSDVETAFVEMFLEEDGELSDDAVCPKCGMTYVDDDTENGLWICCDGCNRWFDLQCTNIRNKRRVPNTYFCEDCKSGHRWFLTFYLFSVLEFNLKSIFKLSHKCPIIHTLSHNYSIY